MTLVKELKDKYYYSVPGWMDGTSQYMDLVNKCVKPGHHVLEIGPGDGVGFSHNLKGKVKRLVGVDIDPDVMKNNAIDEGIIGPIEKLPFDDNSFDIAVSSFALEHIEDPAKAASEIARILKPGGQFIFRTPNIWHYTSMGAKLTPHWFHTLVANRLRGNPASEGDPYPTTFRCNSRRKTKKVFGAAGLTTQHLEVIEAEPSYMQFSSIAFYFGMLWERILNSSNLLQDIRATILGVFEKRENQTE